MADTPLWRRTFDALERPAARVLETAVQSDAFADVLALGVRLRRDVERQSAEAFERWLHLWNLPAYSDVVALQAQAAAVERRLREVAHELEDRAGGPGLGDRESTPKLPRRAARPSKPNGSGGS